MKKIFTTLFVASALLSVSFAQTQRRVLVEEFTQASCGPCAAVNPAFNVMLSANAAKVCQIKYQTDWPGVDPMNAHNPAQVQTRVTYYSVGGVPDGVIDGNFKQSNPGSITANDINTRWGVTSPMEITVSHVINGGDVSVHAVFRATAALSGDIRGHVVITEREIHFLTPPGSNGELDFYGVMKKMLPSDQGTTLPGAMAAGDSIVVDLTWTMANVYNISEIAVVAFAQNNSNKEVYNSEISQPIPLALDAKVLSLSGLGFVCTNSVSSDIVVENTGATPLTSIDLTYKLNNGSATPLAWTGNIAPGATANISIPAQTVTNGKNTMEATIVNINGTPDINTYGNTAKGNVYAYINAGAVLPVAQNYSAVVFPPTDWIVDNPGDDTYKWIRAAQSNGGGTGSAKIPFYDIAAGGVDNLVAPKMDLSSMTAPINLTFDMAHKRYSAAYIDQLTILASTDCGTTWNQIWQKSGAALATATGFVTTAYTPVAADWQAQSANLDAYAGNANVLVLIKAESGFGNNLYFDNFNLFNGSVGINENQLNAGITISPNPSTNGIFNMNVNLESAKNVEIKVTNAIGQEITGFELTKMMNGTFNINLQNQSAGAYMITVTTDGATTTKQVSIVK